MQLIAMGQFEKMIRYDAQLRNFGNFSVYTHPTAHDDSLAVVYIDVRSDRATLLNVTRLNVNPLAWELQVLDSLLRIYQERTGKSFHNGLLAITARSERYTAEFTKELSATPLKALERVLEDPMGCDHEYHSYTAPQAMRMATDLSLSEAAAWIQKNNGTVRSYISFENDGQQFTVLGRQFREESFLMLTSYNPVKQMAYFDGMVSGASVHQRVALNPASFQGDRLFVEHMEGKNIVGEYGTMWRIRHLGYNEDEDGDGFLRGPHVSGFGSQLIPSQHEHDFVENRIIIL